MIGLGLSITQLAVRQMLGGSFNPLDLFSNSEPGVWYDPSDLTTMFQDAAGTTPVTAVEQPVGLILDKSRGLVLGPELVVNGTFESNTVSWTVLSASATFVASGGVATLTVNSGSFFAGQAVTVTPGKWYEVRSTFVSKTAGSLALFRAGTSAIGGTEYFTTTPTVDNSGLLYRVQATSETLYIAIGVNASGYSSVWDNISVRELPGNHASQTTATSRPVLRQDAGGRYYLFFDGIDDSLVTPTITPGTDKAQVFAGVRKLSDAASAMLMELSANAILNAGSFNIQAPVTGGNPEYRYFGGGSISRSVLTSAYSAPITSVLAAVQNISDDSIELRINAVLIGTSVLDQGTGNFGNYPLNIGRRNNSNLPFNGHLHSLIVRFGPTLTAEQITQTETFVNSKTGAY